MMMILKVLILIILDIPFGVQTVLTVQTFLLCLNPYYSGYSFRRYSASGARQSDKISLNPYYSGYSFRRINHDCAITDTLVLILIILDIPFGDELKPSEVT